MAEIMLKRAGGMLFAIDEEGKKFIRGLTGIAKLKIVKPKEKRRDILNRLSHAMYRQAADMIRHGTPQDEKAECKLDIGIPILCEDPDDGLECADYYRRLLSGLDREERLARMHESHRFYAPVTSLMTDKQMKEYVKRCIYHYAVNHGVTILTPAEREQLNYPEARA